MDVTWTLQRWFTGTHKLLVHTFPYIVLIQLLKWEENLTYPIDFSTQKVENSAVLFALLGFLNKELIWVPGQQLKVGDFLSASDKMN